MPQQNYHNHRRYVPLFHYVALPVIFSAIIGAFINLVNTINSGASLYEAVLIFLLCILLLLVCFFARAFALKAQDRVIRLEENFRHYLATGKPLDSKLRLNQIVALRFASDEEFVALSQQAADEKIPGKQIKKMIKNWRTDYSRM
jgi:L-cystine uptake protein TcyP (sodium:dicarboxylate symporter family)